MWLINLIGVVIVIVIMLMQDIVGIFLSLSTEQWALIGWILGALYSLLGIFYLKVRRGDLTWADFNVGFLINFVTNLFLGVAVSLLIFFTWTIPDGSWWAVLLISFGASAGIDQELIIRILKVIGIYKRTAGILSG